MSNQLVKRNPVEGYQNVFPKTFIDAIKDKESGVSLQEILQGFNMYFLSYNGSRALTRCKIPTVLRKEGLWITYVLYDHTVVTEWYNSDQIDDNSWSMDSNWRVASNNLVGDVSVSADGYWVINGEKTEAKAQGEQGVTPLLRIGANNKLQVSYNAGKAWKDISDYIVPRFRWNQSVGTTAGNIQISMDLGNTWTNLSNEITNNLRIYRYIGINESLPTSGVAEGTIYMKGPYYDEGDTSNANPIYRMWIYAWKGDTLAWQDNGEFTSISAGVVQERGTSTTEVMSQDAVSRELTELESEVLTGKLAITEIEANDKNYHYNVIPNRTYQILLNNTTWGDTLSDGVTLLGVFVKYSDSSDELNLIRVNKGDSVVLPSYEFSLENESVEYLRVAINGSQGDELRYVIEDITFINEVEKELVSPIISKLGKIADGWEYGEVRVQMGNLVPNPSFTNRLINTQFIKVQAGDTIYSIYPCNVLFYGTNSVESYNREYSNTSWEAGKKTITSNGYIRLALRLANDGEITDAIKEDMINTTSVAFYVYDALVENNKKITTDVEVLLSGFDTIVADNYTLYELIEDKNQLTSESELVYDDNQKAIGVEDWRLRYVTGENSIEKVEDYYSITLDSSAGSNPAFWLLNKLNNYVGKSLELSFEYRIISAFGNLNFLVGGTDSMITLTKSDWTKVNSTLICGSQYSDSRIMFFSSLSPYAKFDIRNINVIFREPKLEDLVSQKLYDGINLILPNFRYKTSDNNGQCVIGLLGDSWTQHSGASYLPPHSNYVEPLTLALREKYGNAGGGFYSFSISHGNYTSKMGCAVPSDANDTRSSDTNDGRSLITYRDQVEGCKGVDAADATFHTGATLALNIVNPANKLVIHFYGASDAGVFTYSLDNENPIQVNASSYEGYSTIEISTSDKSHTLQFDVISGSVMIFGVDMQRTSKGVRVHKLGNKGATTNSFVIADEQSWKEGIAAFGLDTITILLGTNDGPSATTSVYENISVIIDRIKEVNQYIDMSLIMPSNAPSRNMAEQAKFQYTLAKDKNIGFVNLIPLFGSPSQIEAKGTFYDSLHPTFAGGRMIADYLIKKLFS